MTRLYLADIPPDSRELLLDRKTGHYVRTVLRCREGDELTVFDGTGREYRCRVSGGKNTIVLAVEDTMQSVIRPRRPLVLLQGLLKGQKMDLVVRQCAEIGLTAVVPVVTERSQVRETVKLPRWRKIAEEASRQCRRTDIMRVDEVISLDRVPVLVGEKYPGTFRIVFYEGGNAVVETMADTIRTSQGILLCIGPEGGFSRAEVALLTDSGFAAAGLGSMIMRAETAALVASGIVQYLSGQFS